MPTRDEFWIRIEDVRVEFHGLAGLGTDEKYAVSFDFDGFSEGETEALGAPTDGSSRVSFAYLSTFQYYTAHANRLKAKALTVRLSRKEPGWVGWSSSEVAGSSIDLQTIAAGAEYHAIPLFSGNSPVATLCVRVRMVHVAKVEFCIEGVTIDVGRSDNPVSHFEIGMQESAFYKHGSEPKSESDRSMRSVQIELPPGSSRGSSTQHSLLYAPRLSVPLNVLEFMRGELEVRVLAPAMGHLYMGGAVPKFAGKLPLTHYATLDHRARTKRQVSMRLASTDGSTHGITIRFTMVLAGGPRFQQSTGGLHKGRYIEGGTYHVPPLEHPVAQIHAAAGAGAGAGARAGAGAGTPAAGGGARSWSKSASHVGASHAGASHAGAGIGTGYNPSGSWSRGASGTHVPSAGKSPPPPPPLPLPQPWRWEWEVSEGGRWCFRNDATGVLTPSLPTVREYYCDFHQAGPIGIAFVRNSGGRPAVRSITPGSQATGVGQPSSEMTRIRMLGRGHELLGVNGSILSRYSFDTVLRMVAGHSERPVRFAFGNPFAVDRATWEQAEAARSGVTSASGTQGAVPPPSGLSLPRGGSGSGSALFPGSPSSGVPASSSSSAPVSMTSYASASGQVGPHGHADGMARVSSGSRGWVGGGNSSGGGSGSGGSGTSFPSSSAKIPEKLIGAFAGPFSTRGPLPGKPTERGWEARCSQPGGSRPDFYFHVETATYAFSWPPHYEA